jgi:hypothetical protein
MLKCPPALDIPAKDATVHPVHRGIDRARRKLPIVTSRPRQIRFAIQYSMMQTVAADLDN